MELDFELLKDICPKCIEWTISNKYYIGPEKCHDYYSCESIMNAITYLLTNEKSLLGIDDDSLDSCDNKTLKDEYDSPDLENIDHETSLKDLVFDPKRMYLFRIGGYNSSNDDGEESSNIDHCFIYLSINNQWNIIDAFAPFRKLEKYVVNNDDLKHFIHNNENQFNVDDYNNFFAVNIKNIYNLTNLNCIIESIEWNSCNILPAINYLKGASNECTHSDK